MTEKKEESSKAVGTIDSLDRFRKWLHDNKIVEMSWIPDKPDRKAHWEWCPTELFTICFLYGGASIVLALYMWIMR